MLDFHTPCREDVSWLKNVLHDAQPQCCDYTVGNILAWCEQYNTLITEIEGCLVAKVDGNNLFGFPQGRSFEKTLEIIFNNFEAPSFYGLTKKECEFLDVKYNGMFNFYESRKSFDYVYRTEDLATLKGKKYHSKRNHISYFEKNFNWKYEEITPASLGECIKFNEEWFNRNEEKDPYGIEIERKALHFAFENYELLKFKGGLLKVDGDIVAFTFGEMLNDNTFNTHFEKADADVRGAYPMINMLFARESLKEFEYINREDDVGSEGLRKAKMSYHPEFLVEKYTAVKI